jgi:hypothetical protein
MSYNLYIFLAKMMMGRVSREKCLREPGEVKAGARDAAEHGP